MFLILLASLMSVQAFAETFTLIRDNDGARFECGSGGTGGGTPSNGTCIKQVTVLCQEKSYSGYDSCFNKAVDACKGGVSGDCLVETTNYCMSQTYSGFDSCLGKAKTACRGNGNAIIQMIEEVRKASVDKKAID